MHQMPLISSYNPMLVFGGAAYIRLSLLHIQREVNNQIVKSMGSLIQPLRLVPKGRSLLVHGISVSCEAIHKLVLDCT